MLKARILTAIVALALVGIVLFVLPVRYAEIIIGLLLLAGAWEWSSFLKTSSSKLRFLYTALLGICLIAVDFASAEQVNLLLLVACAWWVVAFLWTFRYPTAIPEVVRWISGVLVIVPLFAALVALLRLGVEYLIFVLLIVWLADGGAYFAGKKFGRVKLAPSISPNKTWEGVVGGMVLVAALAVAAALLGDIPVNVLLPFCLAAGAISVIGDLTVSMFKRTAGVKDSGSLFPGHGGVLDRIDSVAAAAPLFVLGLLWLGLVQA